MGYPGPTVIMSVGDSITSGTGSTAALQSAGYRYLLDVACTAIGAPIKFIGSQVLGTFANNLNEGWPGLATDNIRISSQAARRIQQPEIILAAPGTNDLAVISNNITPAQLLPIYTTFLNELWDYQAHAIPGGGSTLRAVLVSTLLKRPDDLAVTNARVIDWNTNYLPPLVAAQSALGRTTIIVDGYNVVSNFSDNIHPNDAGYQQWLPSWMAKLTPLLRRN